MVFKDVVQVMNLKYKGEPIECTKCSHSMMVVDIVCDYAEGKLEYLTVVDGDVVYPNLTYANFCSKVYHTSMDLVEYGAVCNNVLRGVGSTVILNVGDNITYSEKQEKTVKCEKGKIIMSAKSLRLSRGKDLSRLPKNVVFILGSMYIGVGNLVYDKHFKGKRLGFDNILKGVTQRDIFAKEFANLLMRYTNFANCKDVVTSRNRNTIIVVKLLQDLGFKVA